MNAGSKFSQIFQSADKTANFYKAKPHQYQELLEKSITKDYKKTTYEAVENIDKKDKKNSKETRNWLRVYSLTRQEAFISLKDHKDNFADNPKTRLLNQAKSELGKVSKKILTKVVATRRRKNNLNSWKTHSQ